MKKKKVLIISIIILLVFLILFFFVFNKKKEKKEVLYTVVDSYLLDYKYVSVISSNLLMVSDGSKLGFINYNNELVVDMKYDYESNTDMYYHENFVIITNGNHKLLLDNSGKEVLSDCEVIDVYENLIAVIKNNTLKILNSDLKEIFTASSSVDYEIYDEFFSIYEGDTAKVYDSNGKCIDDGSIFYNDEDYIVLENDNLYNVYYIKSGKSTGYTIDNYSIGDKNILLKINSKYSLYDNTGKLIKEYGKSFDNLELFGNVLVNTNGCNFDGDDYSESIQMYGKTFDLTGKVISNSCEIVHALTNNRLLLVSDNNKISYYKDNKLIKTFDNYTTGYGMDDMHFCLSNQDSNDISIYDNEGNLVLDKLKYLSVEGNYYQSYHDNGFLYILDNNFNYIDNLYALSFNSFDNGILYQTIDGTYGIYSDTYEKLVEPIYNDCISQNSIALCTYKGKYVFHNVKKVNAVEKEKHVTKKIDVTIDNNIVVDKIIEDYKLSDMKTLITENSELFKKYAYYVVNNDELGEFKINVLKFFKIVVDVQKYLDLDALMENLSNLKIKYYTERPESMLSYSAGEYNHGSLEISLVENADRVIYHELVHFLQYNKNRKQNNVNSNIYVCNDKYYDILGAMELGDDVFKTCKVEFLSYMSPIEEASAEENSSEYFNTGIPTTYLKEVQIFEILEYLLGTEQMNEISFSSTRNTKLFFIFNKYLSWNIDQFIEFSDYLSHINDIDLFNKINEENVYSLYKVSDILVDLYKNIRHENWYEDQIFVSGLRTIISNDLDITTYLKNNKLTIKYLDIYNSSKFDIPDFISDKYSYIFDNQIIINSKNSLYNSKNAVIYNVFNYSSYKNEYYGIFYEDNNITEKKVLDI